MFEAGLGGKVRIDVVLSKHVEQPAHLDECVPAGVLDCRQRLARGGLLPLEYALSRLRLNDDDADRVSDDVVELSRDS